MGGGDFATLVTREDAVEFSAPIAGTATRGAAASDVNNPLRDKRFLISGSCG